MARERDAINHSMKENKANLRDFDEPAYRVDGMASCPSTAGSVSTESSSQMRYEEQSYLGGMLEGLTAMAAPYAAATAHMLGDDDIPESAAGSVTSEDLVKQQALLMELGLSDGRLEQGYLTETLFQPPSKRRSSVDGDGWDEGREAEGMKKAASLDTVQDMITNSQIRSHITGLSGNLIATQVMYTIHKPAYFDQMFESFLRRFETLFSLPCRTREKRPTILGQNCMRNALHLNRRTPTEIACLEVLGVELGATAATARGAGY